MGILTGMNTWSTVLRSPWRISLTVSALPLVVTSGIYLVELGGAMVADSEYQEHGQDVCRLVDERDVDSIHVEPYLFATDTSRHLPPPSWSIPHTGCAEPDKGSTVFLGYMGEMDVSNWLHGTTAKDSDGRRSGKAQLGLVGKVVDGKLHARVFCVSSGNYYGPDYSGLEYTKDGNALAWGYGVGPDIDVDYLLSGLSESRSPLPDELEVTRKDLRWVEYMDRNGMMEAIMPQGVCSPVMLEYSSSDPANDSFEGGSSGCHGDTGCGRRHLAHELKRMKAWAMQERNRIAGGPSSL